MTAPRFATASVAARALGLSRQRLSQLLRAGRIEGAFQVGSSGIWVMPICDDGKPRVLPGKTDGRGRPRLLPVENPVENSTP